MNIYIIEMNGVPILTPKNTDIHDLRKIMEYVDRMRIEYPSQTFTIYEIIKQVIDY